MTAQVLPFLGRRARPGPGGRLWWLLLVGGFAVLYVVFRGQGTVPHEDDTAVFSALNGVRDWVDEARRTSPVAQFVLEGFQGVVAWTVETMIGFLVGVGWPAVLALGATLGYATGGWRVALVAISGLLVVGALGLWEPAMETLGITLAAVVFSLAIGVPIGILAGKSDRARSVLNPILDVMQIMPQFAYLVPFVLLFGIGPAAAAIVTLIYAMPAAIRITALGIRGVPSSPIEAARSLGATGGQVLRIVELPLARYAIGLAVNQTIMLALSMVVITVVIAAPGLGENILRALERLDVGSIFDAGLAIVILAIILDRITEHASQRMDPRQIAQTALARRRIDRRIVLAALGLVTIAAIAYGAVQGETVSEFPEDIVALSFREPVNEIIRWVRRDLFFLTEGIQEGITAVVVNPLETLFTTAPAWLMILGIAGMGLLLSGTRAALVAALALLGILGLQLWDHAMQTLATVLVATALTLAIGVLLGILAARSNRFSRGLRPFLDAAQTMPAFVYLLPAVALFGTTRFTAIFASIIFAVPPVVRLVEAGIRIVPATIVEAAHSAGATGLQLLWKVQLPIARPTLMLALNQGLVMVLGMVVLGGIVGAGALGFDVVAGFAQRRDFGLGLAAGSAIVLLGIALDRVTQGAGRRKAIEPVRERPAAATAARVETAPA
jgi:glycine betaine/proline transport system permease protein